MSVLKILGKVAAVAVAAPVVIEGGKAVVRTAKGKTDALTALGSILAAAAAFEQARGTIKER